MYAGAHAVDFKNNSAPDTGRGISPRTIENLWVRLKAGNRVRPRDAQLLKRLKVRPFDGCGVYELDACGYVVAVGLPGCSELLDDAVLLHEFEILYGIPRTFFGPIVGKVRKSYGT